MKDQELKFKKFIQDNQILIVDKNNFTRKRLVELLVSLGAKDLNIHSVNSFQEAISVIESHSIKLILSDYSIVGGSGFELFKVINEKYPMNKDIVNILVTSNISQAAVTEAAEKEVDAFIIKPFTQSIFTECLMAGILSRIAPGDYLEQIEMAKTLMEKANYDKAIEILNEAAFLHPRPALAFFYIGQAEYLKASLQNAHDAYKQGINYNNIHFKCLMGLYEAFLKEGKLELAYDVIKKLVNFFPANSQRMTEIIRLAIQTENFRDMQKFYKIFSALDQKTPELINFIGAGLYISGKHHLIRGQIDEAVKVFDQVAMTCMEQPKFIRAAIVALIKYEQVQKAEKYLDWFEGEGKSSTDYKVSEFLINYKRGKKEQELIHQGLELYDQNVREGLYLEALVDLLQRDGHHEDKLQALRRDLEQISIT